MPYLKTYDLFISHSWKYGDDYDRIVNLLKNADYFKWRNYSCPEHDPAIDSATDFGKNQLVKALKNQIRPVNCVIILAGLYVSYSYWIKEEIDISVEFGKPIIGVLPWGSSKIPQYVASNAIEVVGWNTSSILDAVRKNSL